MKTICFTLVMASLIAIYSSSSADPPHLAKITFTISDIKDYDISNSIYKELKSLKGVEGNNINLDAGTLELVIDYNLFSLDDFKTSLDKWGCAFEDFEVEDVYH